MQKLILNALNSVTPRFLRMDVTMDIILRKYAILLRCFYAILATIRVVL